MNSVIVSNGTIHVFIAFGNNSDECYHTLYYAFESSWTSCLVKTLSVIHGLLSKCNAKLSMKQVFKEQKKQQRQRGTNEAREEVLFPIAFKDSGFEKYTRLSENVIVNSYKWYSWRNDALSLPAYYIIHVWAWNQCKWEVFLCMEDYVNSFSTLKSNWRK